MTSDRGLEVLGVREVNGHGCYFPAITVLIGAYFEAFIPGSP